jgi:hypothetical protein
MKSNDFIANFSTLRNAYIEIKAFLEEESFDKVTDLSTKIEGDLGLAGDDILELIEKFVDKYSLGYKGYDHYKYFLSEGELFDAFTPLYHVLMLPIWLLKIISSGKINLLPPKGYWNRETHDLTFGDMVSWYLTKNFNLRSDICIQLSVN